LKPPPGVVLSVDEFQGDLEGLRMVEAEFDTAERMASFPMPDFAIREVTDDPRFSGGHLVTNGLPREL
jgi:CYTH domain-containing protein